MSPREFDLLEMDDIYLLWEQLQHEQREASDTLAGMRR